MSYIPKYISRGYRWTALGHRENHFEQYDMIRILISPYRKCNTLPPYRVSMGTKSLMKRWIKQPYAHKGTRPKIAIISYWRPYLSSIIMRPLIYDD